MIALVTGGTGFIGARLCRRLAGDGAAVSVLSRTAASRAGAPGVTMVGGDLEDIASLRAALRAVRPTVLFHLASRRPEEFAAHATASLLSANGEATYRVLEACMSEEARPVIVYASAMGVYDYARPRYVPIDEAHPAVGADAYGVSKLAGEVCCAHFAATRGLAVTALRISGVYGPGKAKGLIHACLDAAATGAPVSLGDPELRRDFVYVDDVVDALVRAAYAGAAPGCSVYNIGGGAGHSLAEVVEIAGRVVGRSVPVARGGRPGAGGGYHLAIERAGHDLGYRPRSLAEGMAAFWAESWRAHVASAP